MQNKHTDLQKPEELYCDEANQSLNMSVFSEERSNTSLSHDNSIAISDNPVKTKIEKNNT